MTILGVKVLAYVLAVVSNIEVTLSITKLVFVL